MSTEASQPAEVSGGMPQLDISTFPNQIFWLLITLAVIYIILSRVALPRVAAVLSDRQGTITKDLATAEDLKQAALDAEEAYNKALAEARAKAQAIIASAKSEMQADLDTAIARADAEIAAKAAESVKAITAIRDSARELIRDVATETAGNVILAFGGKADAKVITAAIAARMKG